MHGGPGKGDSNREELPRRFETPSSDQETQTNYNESATAENAVSGAPAAIIPTTIGSTVVETAGLASYEH